MKDNGKMTFNMVLELRPGLMDRNMKAIIKKERNMAMVLIFGQMVLNIKDHGRTIK